VRLALLLALIPAAAAAGDYVMPRIPDEVEKTEALRQAYQLRDYVRIIPTTKVIPDPVPPVAAPPPAPVAAPVKEAQDICTRHGLHKVVRGSSWHCRKRSM